MNYYYSAALKTDMAVDEHIITFSYIKRHTVHEPVLSTCLSNLPWTNHQGEFKEIMKLNKIWQIIKGLNVKYDGLPVQWWMDINCMLLKNG